MASRSGDEKVDTANPGRRNEIVVYRPDETLRLDVRLADETVWLPQARLAVLFGVDRSVVNRHIHNIYGTGELQEKATCAKIAQVQNEGGRSISRMIPFYNLDIIIAVGYRVNSLQATRFRQWATSVLREYLLRGYVFSSRINQLEDKLDRRLADHDRRIDMLEDKVEFFVRTSQLPVQGVFYDGQVFDAKVFAIKYILSAKKSIFLIDNWVDVVTLEMLAKKKRGVTVEIIASPRGNHLAASDIATFNAQYGGLTVRTSVNYHDRFVIVDDKAIYLFGTSLKDLGKKCFAFTKLDSSEIPELKARA